MKRRTFVLSAFRLSLYRVLPVLSNANVSKDLEVKRILCAALFCTIFVGCNSDTASKENKDRDNTAVNTRDANSKTITPMDQSNDSSDIKQVAAIRKAVLDIKDISTNGRNVKIITSGGKVTLRGPVDSTAERDAITQTVEKQVGAENVTNELEVKAH